MVAAAFGRQFRTRRRAEDGDVRSSDKARKVEKSLTDEVVEETLLNSCQSGVQFVVIGTGWCAKEMDRKMVECAQAGDFAGAGSLFGLDYR